MLFKRSIHEKLLVIIDEFPYLCKADRSLHSVLQNLIDAYRDRSKMTLVLCGSSMTCMTKEILPVATPLEGRFITRINIKPFDFFESCTFLSSFSAEDKVALYGALGGTPMYLSHIQSQLSARSNIRKLFLDTRSALHEEPMTILRKEAKSTSQCVEALRAIAEGASRFTEIQNAAHFEAATTSAVIEQLIRMDLVKKESPFGDRSGRKTIYSIADNFFRFWFRFVSPNESAIEGGFLSDLVYREIEKELPTYLGPVFEEICRDYLVRRTAAGDLPAPFFEFHRWWGSDPRTRQQSEIDIVSAAGKDAMLFAECKWRNAPVDADVLQTLLARSNLFNALEKYLMIFSKSGFTENCRAAAQKIGRVELVSLSDMMAELNPEAIKD
ncbi:ATP-binding protein [uncultured Sutterella sp.]|uniref:ATP-binding protein n=1 Tax=uncultured Sutterella sp. TaxID=286133 RepID=UPI002606068D|nr:ATP-binding protein [uncultured Sutterella sp.]